MQIAGSNASCHGPHGPMRAMGPWWQLWPALQHSQTASQAQQQRLTSIRRSPGVSVSFVGSFALCTVPSHLMYRQ